MRRIDPRYYVIALLVAAAASLGYYRATHPAAGHDPGRGVFSGPLLEPTPERVRSMIDTTAKMLGTPKKFIARRTAVDSGRAVPELAIGVPASFDELRLITALTDSLRPAGCTVSAQKSLKEKTTVIRISDRGHQCMYRCLLYRKEWSH
jgi:hypothetical protein